MHASPLELRHAVDGYHFVVTAADVGLDGRITPVDMTYSWVSGPPIPGRREWRTISVRGVNGTWCAQITRGFKGPTNEPAITAATPAEAVAGACASQGLAWPPKPGKA